MSNDNEHENKNQDIETDYTPAQQHIVNMITAQLNGNEEEAAKEVQQAFNIKTADILSNWYHMSSDLKSVLDKMSKG